MIKTKQNDLLFDEAKDVFVGGVNSPVRAYKNVGGHPVFFSKGMGPYIYGEDGQRYIDYVLSWGPLLLGHADEDVVLAIQHAAKNGTTFGGPSKGETVLAKQLQEFYPTLEMMRFVNSGTEATMSALRLARGISKRDKIVKFSGCYHGHSDGLLVQAGSGGLTLGQPSSAGIPQSIAEQTLVAQFNDLDSLQSCFESHPNDIAAVIIEPIPGNMGVILPEKGFLEGVRDLCSAHGSLLIFDEVMCGFRGDSTNCSERFSVIPDLTCLGKVVGGGMPFAVFGGRKDLMTSLAPEGPVYQAGTLSGNPLCVAAGIATLKKIKESNAIEKAAENTKVLVRGLEAIITESDVDATVNSTGSMWTLFFNPDKPKNLDTVLKSNEKLFSNCFNTLLDSGIHTAPSPFEANFMSSVHSKEDLQQTLNTFKTVFLK